MFLLVLLCPLRFKQGVLTVMAAYLRHKGDESGAGMLERVADKFNEIRQKQIGAKFVKVEVTCECGITSLAHSGVAVFRPGFGCPDLPPVPPPSSAN